MTVSIAALDALLPPRRVATGTASVHTTGSLPGAVPYDRIRASGLGAFPQRLVEAIEAVRSDHRWASVYGGDLTAYTGDQSKADLALCGHFFRLGLDANLIDTAMRTSGLYREKWERDDYRNRTISLAIASTPAPDKTNSPPALLSPENGRIDASALPPSRRDWLIDGMLLSGKSAILAGLSGLSKTQLALQLSMQVAMGRPFAGRATKSGVVLFLSGEEDRAEMQRRVNAVIRHQGFAQADIDRVRSNLFAFPLVGHDIRLTHAQGGTLQATDFARDIIEASAEHTCVRLIVIDHAGLAHGGDFNAKQDAAQTMRIVNSISAETGAAVILLAHSPKASASAPEPGASMIFGSSAFVEQARGGWVMTTMTEDQARPFGISKLERASYVALTGVKANYTQAGQEFWFRRFGFDEVGLLEHVPLIPSAPRPKGRPSLEEFILQEVGGSPGRYSKTGLRDQFHGKKDGLWKSSKAEIDHALGDLIEAGRLINRPPTVDERNRFGHGGQVRHVLDVPLRPQASPA